jgi:hypothetical protein
MFLLDKKKSQGRRVRTSTVDDTPFSKASLKSTDEHEPEAHEERADEQHGSTTPSVNIDNSRHYPQK